MKQKRRRVLAGLLALFTMIFCLSGCASEDAGTPNVAKDGTIELTSVDPAAVDGSGELFFASKLIEFEREMPFLASLYQVADRYFMCGNDLANEERGFLMEVDLEGNILKDYDVSFLADREHISIVKGNTSQIWICISGENESRTETYRKYGVLSENSAFEEKFCVVNNGESTSSISENLYVAEDCIYQARTYLDGTFDFAVTAYDGEVIDKIEIPYLFTYKIEGDNIYLSQDNFASMDSSACSVYHLNMETKELSEVCSFDTGNFVAAKDGYIYVSNSTSVFRYSIADGVTELLFTWNGVNLYASAVIYPLDCEHFLIPQVYSTISYYIVSPAPPDTRQTIVLATDAQAAMYSSAVMAFNSSDADYKIVVKDYSAYANGQDILNTELVAGNGPDIIDLTVFSEDISRSNILEDLVPYFEKSENYSLNDLMEAPLSVIMAEGKLTSFIPLFTVRTFICPEQYMPEGGFQGIRDFEERIGDVSTAFDGRLSRSSFLQLAFCGDYAESYTVEDIEAILRIAKQLPESVTPPSGSSFPLFSTINVGGVPVMRYYRIVLNSNIAFAGLPFCANNTGLLIPVVEFGMNSQSEVKEGVWRFFEYFLSPDVYESAAGNTFSLSKAGYEYALQSDRESIEEGLEMHMTVNGKDMTIEITDTSDQVYCEELLRGIHGVFHRLGPLYPLVTGAAAKYFAGDESVESAAEAIASKISVYRAERN